MIKATAIEPIAANANRGQDQFNVANSSPAENAGQARTKNRSQYQGRE